MLYPGQEGSLLAEIIAGECESLRFTGYWWALIFNCRWLPEEASLLVTLRDLLGRIGSISRRSL